jgi:HSP20 family protein
MKTHEKSRSRNALISSYWRSPVDRFFRNDFMNLWGGAEQETIPSVNIREEKDNYKVDLAAPGLKKEDFSIGVEGNVLTIQCEKESENKEGGENENYSRREYNYSSFSRSLSLPDNADSSKIEAKYTDGILCLNIPKKTGSAGGQSQKIEVH